MTAWLASLGRYGAMCSLPKSHCLMASPAIGSTIHATPTAMSSAATWLGIRIPAPSPIRAHSPSTSRLSTRVRNTCADGNASAPRACSVIAPTSTEPTRLSRPYAAATSTSASTLPSITRGRRGWVRNVLVMVRCRYSAPIWITPITSISR